MSGVHCVSAAGPSKAAGAQSAPDARPAVGWANKAASVAAR